MADLRITRDKTGGVVIVDVATGRSERIETDKVDRPVDAVIVDKERLPGHFWGRLEA